MTAFEIVTLIIAVPTLLCAFGMFLVTLLAYLENRHKRK